MFGLADNTINPAGDLDAIVRSQPTLLCNYLSDTRKLDAEPFAGTRGAAHREEDRPDLPETAGFYSDRVALVDWLVETKRDRQRPC